jgi:hypothetical protein
MNGEAVALAADSAVTVRRASGQKIFTSANKLFALSRYAPVGVMIYSNAMFIATPWETVIKTFRADLGTTKFKTLDDYADALLDHLTTQRAFSPAALQRKFALTLVHEAFTHIKFHVEKDVKKALVASGPLSGHDMRTLLRRLFREHIRRTSETYKNAKYMRGFSGRVRSQFRAMVGDIENLSREVFQKAPIEPSARKLLVELALDYLTKGCGSLAATGVVVAGFGEREMFPALVAMDIDGVVANRVRFTREPTEHVRPDNLAVVRPFAQSEMVQAFMEGVDPGYQRAIEDDITRVLNEYPRTILAAIPGLAATTRARLEKRFSKISIGELKKSLAVFNNYRTAKFVRPVVEVVTALPKNELAHMAETLVALTSFKRRISMEAETVSDPIDVAVISKGDGFIWIKRKHYFKPELNAQFFRMLNAGGDK